MDRSTRGKYENRKENRGFSWRTGVELLILAAATAWCVVALNHWEPGEALPEPPPSTQPSQAVTDAPTEPLTALEAFITDHGLTMSDYPESILELLERNPEAEEFALNYPLEYGKDHEIDMTEFENSESMPLFLQWDKRWGYLDYGSSVAGLAACGPVSLAMVGYHLTGSDDFRPDRVIQFALDNGYCVPGNGTSWTLISEGGEKLGLKVTEIPLDKNRMAKNLQLGNPIICIMGPGVFTTTGHYIVLTGYEDGKFRVNDCNSREKSEKLWEYEEFQDQIRNLWVIQK